MITGEHIEIRGKGPRGRDTHLKIDGRDISSNTQRIELTVDADDVNVAELTLMVAPDVDTHAITGLTRATVDWLVGLGWTPPADPHQQAPLSNTKKAKTGG